MKHYNDERADDANTTDSKWSKTPNTPQIFSQLEKPKSQLEAQILLTLSLANLLLLGSIIALFVKFGWMAILAILAL